MAPAPSFTTLPADLATLTLNEAELPGSSDRDFPLMAEPTGPRRRAIEWPGIGPAQDVAM